MPMKLYLASGNAHKAREFQALADAGALPVEVISAVAIGGMPPVAEDTGAFAGNARKKARTLKERLPAGDWALADDSGLCVDALGGAPGVESAYYAGPQLVAQYGGIPPYPETRAYVSRIIEDYNRKKLKQQAQSPAAPADE